MSFIIIIQARMGSQRFPGKSLFKFYNKPSLEYLIDSLKQQFNLADIIIATSVNSENDVIREYCIKNNLMHFSGDENNVASRFVEILKNLKKEYFVRLSGDSPLFDFRLLQNGINQINNNSEIISTIFETRFPSGMNFEIFRKDIFLNSVSKFSKESHFEHVTKYFYENSSGYNIQQIIPIVRDYKKYNFSFDTKEDANRIKKILENITKPHYFYTFVDKCKLYDTLFNHA